MSTDMNERDMHYALAKQVPEMRSGGFAIQTAYGDIGIVPGLLASRIASLVAAHLNVELRLVALSRQAQREPQA